MNFIRLMIRQPVTVAVGVILVLMAGAISLSRVPIQLTPNVEDTVIAVTTMWEGASPDEVEREIVEKQEEKLQGLTNLRAMTSESEQGVGKIRLEFAVGTLKDVALREVSDKLREVPDYPLNADEPVVEASDPENQDYIAWIVFGTTDDSFDIRTLQDFADDRIKPMIERIEGVSEVNALGGRERETQIRFDPVRLAQHGIPPSMLVGAIQNANRNISAGRLPDAKFDVRLRTVNQYESVRDVEDTVITMRNGSPVYVGDVAEVVETFKEQTGFVRASGRPVIAINAQKEIGANVIDVMDRIRAVVATMNEPGGILETEAERRQLEGTLSLKQVYDQTIYIDQALALVRDNIWLGGIIAFVVLLIFLRSVRSVLIIGLAIPISVIGAVVVMLVLGRTVNVISLAGMAFAVGMVVDNSIVVLENIFRHLEMGKSRMVAAFDGTREVWGAVMASTLTTIVVFIPILLIQDEAGQLFRDIALAICAAVGLSFIVAVTVIPASAARLLREVKPRDTSRANARPVPSRLPRFLRIPWNVFTGTFRALANAPDLAARLIYWLCGSTVARLAVVIGLTSIALLGSYLLMPPIDYLPRGNRNIVFGLLIPPPGYNTDQQIAMAKRIEAVVEPYWEAAKLEPGSVERAEAERALPTAPTFNYMAGQPGDPVVPPSLENYFVVGRENTMFHGGIATNGDRIVDVVPLFAKATSAERVPGVLAFAFQLPLFRLGGSTGSAVKIDFSGDDLSEVASAATAVMTDLYQIPGVQVQPSPSNFNIFGPELRLIPNARRLADLGLTPTDLGLAVQANGDGAIIGEYRIGGDSIDLKLIASSSVDRTMIQGFEDIPIATPTGNVVPLSTLAEIRRVTSPPQINHVARQRSVTLQLTPPPGMPLQEAVDTTAGILQKYRDSGVIPPTVQTGFAGSASKLESVRNAMLGDGSFLGTMSSSLVLALIVVYLLMCVLFQSFAQPLIIMFSVPLATLGGFMALFAVFVWTAGNRYMPMQSLDVLTMLGFIILIGIVVNNAILIVHQALHLMRGEVDIQRESDAPLPARRAISESVRTRIRPIFMGTLTSVGGMAPLVLMPGSGSELYRGLGSVVLGGLLVSTIFTVLLVPLLFSLVMDVQASFARRAGIDSESSSVGQLATRR